MKRKFIFIILSFLAAVYLFPVIVTIMKSLQYGDHRITLRQYAELLITNHTAMRYFWNSALYAGLITLICIILSFPLGFLFAKVTFKGRDVLFFVYITVMLLPFQATLLPNYIQLRDMGILHTRYALMVPMMFSPFAVFFFRQFIVGIPNDVLDYTMLETSSVFHLLRYVVIPQIKPAIAAVSVLIFCDSWNMVEQAIIFASEEPDIMPLSVVLTQLPKYVTYAGATVYLYPVLVVFLLFRDTLQNAIEKYKW
jgi:multiple sugar transport system permease protein